MLERTESGRTRTLSRKSFCLCLRICLHIFSELALDDENRTVLKLARDKKKRGGDIKETHAAGPKECKTNHQ